MSAAELQVSCTPADQAVHPLLQEVMRGKYSKSKRTVTDNLDQHLAMAQVIDQGIEGHQRSLEQYEKEYEYQEIQYPVAHLEFPVHQDDQENNQDK